MESPASHCALDIVEICQGLKIGYPPKSSSFLLKVLEVSRLSWLSSIHAYLFMKLLKIWLRIL